jgi:hypothetical protein
MCRSWCPSSLLSTFSFRLSRPLPDCVVNYLTKTLNPHRVSRKVSPVSSPPCYYVCLAPTFVDPNAHLLLLAAHASSPATADALLNELNQSQSMIIKRLTSAAPDMLPKAYHFSGEMEEIADFVGNGQCKTAERERWKRSESLLSRRRSYKIMYDIMDVRGMYIIDKSNLKLIPGL